MRAALRARLVLRSASGPARCGEGLPDITGFLFACQGAEADDDFVFIAKGRVAFNAGYTVSYY
jgi:hypothetical protein